MLDQHSYTAGLYLRLSKDDDGRNESVSIGTQRDILTDYCNENGFAIHRAYIDDGYSGLNFDRPDFKEMLDDIDRGIINMVITKDLSRFEYSVRDCAPRPFKLSTHSGGIEQSRRWRCALR